MIKAQVPKNEVQRLKALHSLKLLDTQPEERFDRIIRIAQNLFNVPIALVSLVDKEREWFKSKNRLMARETPREISFGAHVILQENIMVVKDTFNDTRFKDNPLVTNQPDIRFYLGCPIKTSDQFNIGTLCLIDHKPQQLNSTDLNIFKDLAGTVESEINSSATANLDELTQLPNRHAFLLAGKKALKLCNKFDKSLFLLYFDLHNIKLINEHFGTHEGDKILKIFAEQLLKNFRTSDMVARLEGDVFCVLCPGMRKEHVANAIKKLQLKLSSAHLTYPIEFNISSISFDRMKHYSIESLIEDADKKMYEYKRFYH